MTIIKKINFVNITILGKAGSKQNIIEFEAVCFNPARTNCTPFCVSCMETNLSQKPVISGNIEITCIKNSQEAKVYINVLTSLKGLKQRV